MVNNQQEGVKNYLLQHGKNDSYNNIGNKFGVTGDAVRGIYRRLKSKGLLIDQSEAETAIYITDLEDALVSVIEDLQKGTCEKTANVKDQITTLEELIQVCKIDTEVWNIDKYIQNFWAGNYQVKAFLSKKKGEDKFLNEFQNFLETYNSPHIPIMTYASDKGLNNGALVINKQDSHLNKYDLGGNNDIIDRFKEYRDSIEKTLLNANKLVRLNKIVYIIGSDEFNSEFTGTTTKGTPQENILPYHVSFQLICNHEVEIINLLLNYTSNVEVIYLQGNHDEYVGFHMASWLRAYYKDQTNLEIDMSTNCTKYRSIYDTAICINHGDAQKPERLANNFPIAYKEGFSKANYWAILTGDKHTELSRSIGGIKFYQIPAISKSVSKWDQKQGYDLGRAEVSSFLIEEGKGINYIIKEPIFETNSLSV